MARLAAIIWAAVVLLGGMVSAATAQSYPTLHVAALAQYADRATVEPGGVFHVTIHVKITEHRDRLDELILGAFENCEIISNETVRDAGPGGTDFVERLTLQALAPGDATISPAYIDAIDPTLGKPMRFSSNAIRVHVSGPTPVDGLLHSFASIARRLLLAIAIVAGLFAAAFVVVVLFARRRRRSAPRPVSAAPPAPVAPAALAPATNDILLRTADAYRRERSPAALANVRAALFALAGAASGATLIDALRSLGDRDAELRRALLAAEHAAFGPAGERSGAGDRMLTAIAAYAAPRGAPNEDAWIR